MGGKLGLHHVAALAAELDGFHVLDGAITQLASDDYVCQRHNHKEDTRAPPGDPPVRGISETGAGPAPGKRDTYRDQPKAGEKDNRNGDEDE